jgi:hypothetical protein
MRNSYTTLLISSLTVLLFSPGTPAQSRGSISGTVQDETGKPVSEAKVRADPMDRQPVGSAVRYVQTDAEGHFRIDHLDWGKYKVFAEKEEAGYPDTYWSFYSDDAFLVATLTPLAPVADIRISLGPKAGVIKGVVRDSITGAPLNAGFKLTRATDPKKWISTSVSSDYRVLLPPSTDVLLEVSAPGFKTWTLSAPLRLQAGTEMHLDIPLEPANDPTLQPSKFLVPDGYMGWLQLEYGIKDAPPVPVEGGVRIFKFPPSGVLKTSSSGPARGAQNQYSFYSADGSTRDIPTDYRNGNGMIWGQHEGSRGGVMTLFGFFVGAEEQYKKQMTH